MLIKENKSTTGGRVKQSAGPEGFLFLLFRSDLPVIFFLYYYDY